MPLPATLPTPASLTTARTAHAPRAPRQRGIGDLTNATHYNGGNEPHSQPWIYDPYAPTGARFSVPGAKTKIARLYHAVAQLTSRGDILAVGCGSRMHVDVSRAGSQGEHLHASMRRSRTLSSCWQCCCRAACAATRPQWAPTCWPRPPAAAL